MSASIIVHLTLSDGFTAFDLFGPAWTVIKIGQRDDDYEPGYIATKHSASTSLEFDLDQAGLMQTAMRLTEATAKTVTDCRAVDKHAHGTVSIRYDFVPPLMMPLVMPIECLSALIMIGLPVVVCPHLDCWVETRETDGAMIAKYERII